MRMGRQAVQAAGPEAGFTLLELTLSASVMAILIGVMASAVLLVSHALPDEQHPTARAAAISGSSSSIVR